MLITNENPTVKKMFIVSGVLGVCLMLAAFCLFNGQSIVVKLFQIGSMALGTLLFIVSLGYFVIRTLKKEVSQMRKDVGESETAKVGNVKSLLEMIKLLDEKLISPDEFEAYKKSYLHKS